jgi:hypothetical protein
MASNAINQTASILSNNAAQYQNANARIFDAITSAADAYEARRRAREAALEEERKRQAEMKAAEQAIALDPEKAIIREAMARGVDPNSVTPEMRAAAAAGKEFLSAKVAADQFGRAYKPYDFGTSPADMMAPAMPVAATPTVSTVDLMAPMATAGGLLPPPAALKDGETRMVMNAPSPVGEPDVKRSAIASVRPPNMIAGAAGPIPDPVDQKRYEAELAAAKDVDIAGAKTEAEKRAADFGKKKLQNIIEQMQKVNEQLKQAGGLKSEKQGLIGNTIDTLRNSKVPVIGTEVGRAAEGVLDPKTAKLKQEYERLRALGFQFYKNASGLSASQMNTEKEQELALSVFGDTGGFYEANKSALENLAREYGTGGGEKPSGLDTTDPRIKRALDAGYTEAQIRAYLNGK